MLAPCPSDVEAEFWTPKLVKACMVKAFKTLRRLPDAVGPKGASTAWPASLREVGSLIQDMQGMSQVAAGTAPPRKAPTAQEIALMEEALRWPVRFLSDFAKGADALNLWAACKGGFGKISHELAKRAHDAKEIAFVVEKELNARRIAKREAAAFDASQWAKMRFKLSPRTAEAKDRIIENALIRLERDLRGQKVVRPWVIVDPVTVFPDKVIAETTMEENRDLAAQIIADRLARN